MRALPVRSAFFAEEAVSSLCNAIVFVDLNVQLYFAARGRGIVTPLKGVACPKQRASMPVSARGWIR